MIESIQKALKEGKLVIGTKATLKGIRQGKVKEVFLASNTPESVKEEMEVNAKIGEVKVSVLKQDNIALGALCKKPFSIGVVSY